MVGDKWQVTGGRPKRQARAAWPLSLAPNPSPLLPPLRCARTPVGWYGSAHVRAQGVLTGTTPPRLGRLVWGLGWPARCVTPLATDCRWAWGISCVLRATMRADARMCAARLPRPRDWNRLWPHGPEKAPGGITRTRGLDQSRLSIGYWLLAIGPATHRTRYTLESIPSAWTMTIVGIFCAAGKRSPLDVVNMLNRNSPLCFGAKSAMRSL